MEMISEWKEFEITPEGERILIFDVTCDRCNYDRHRCPGCGDSQRHDGKSVHDGHTASDCFEYR